MEKIGEKIKALRLQRQLKQKEFAKGICSNVTLSNIENGKQNPSMDMLLKICEKLSITLQDLYGRTIDTENSYYLEELFNELQRLCGMYQHKEAYELLNKKVCEEQLTTVDFQKKYYYYLGITQTVYLKKTDEAIFNFSRVLNTENEGDFETIEDVLALNGLGVAYRYQNEMDKASFYFDKSLKHMKKFETTKASEQKEMAKISFNTAKYYSEKEEYQKAINLCIEGLNVLSQIDSRYNLGALYFELGYNFCMLGDKIEAAKHFFVAKGLAFIDENQHIIEAVDEVVEQYHLSFNSIKI